MPQRQVRHRDESHEEEPLSLSQSLRQGEYMSRTLRPNWSNPSSAQEPPAREDKNPDAISTKAFHAESPPTRVSKHVPFRVVVEHPPRVLASWDGVVIKVGPESFTARVVPVGAPGPEQLAEFALADVSEADADLFRPGAVFYWTIAYRTNGHGRVRRVSEIRFRRLPRLEPDEGEAEWVEETARLFRHDGSHSARA